MPLDDNRRKVVDPLKEEVRRRGLWATHLGPDWAVRATDSSSSPC